MYCHKCGNKNPDRARYCMQCRAELVGEGVVEGSGSARPAATIVSAIGTNAPTLSTGNKIIGPAAALGLILFFTPWVLVSCGSQPIASFSGWDLAQGTTIGAGRTSQSVGGTPELFLVPLAAIACLVCVYLAYRRSLSVKMGAGIAIAAAAISLLVLFSKFANSQTEASQMGVTVQLQYGFWGTVLANLAAIAGGALDVAKPPPDGT